MNGPFAIGKWALWSMGLHFLETKGLGQVGLKTRMEIKLNMDENQNKDGNKNYIWMKKYDVCNLKKYKYKIHNR